MNTNEFIQALADRLHVSRKEATHLLQDTTKVFRETIAGDKKLTLVHLGSFQLKKSSSRTAYIPALHKKALVPPKRVVQFHAAETLKEKLKKTRLP